ncbi:MAG: hypothetical protein CVV46_15445 [Spirochaetae bacterium HGW-Spirochaetae-2]|nr:MAG: hypothetical protein CVV46_15445 [Spirochaetae bacterium HGW-Spirochaetae-2]
MIKSKSSKIFLAILLVIIIIPMAFIGCDASMSVLGSPEVSSTFPSNVATGANINGTITATFADSVDSTTINDATFTISAGGLDISGIVTYDGPNKKAIFAPSMNLGYSTEYTATLTTGVKNLESTAMTEANVWTFTTADAGIGPTPVNLRTAANYVMLAKNAISTIPNSVITGDVGISPAAETYMTGFSQTDSTGYATSTQVTGFLYAADMVSPTSSNLTTAVEDMLTAYGDAAGRITPDFSNLGAGEIGSLTLSPGLYNWTSSVTVGSNVTISGGANDTWIFQVTGDLSIGSDFDVILSGGAQAKNIVWQVSGTVTLEAGAHFEGIVLSQTAITLNTGASINGRLLAQSRIDLDQATVTNPAM